MPLKTRLKLSSDTLRLGQGHAIQLADATEVITLTDTEPWTEIVENTESLGLALNSIILCNISGGTTQFSLAIVQRSDVGQPGDYNYTNWSPWCIYFTVELAENETFVIPVQIILPSGAVLAGIAGHDNAVNIQVGYSQIQ